MKPKTTTTNIEIKKRVARAEENITKPITFEETTDTQHWPVRFLQADRLVRNFAVVGVLMLTVVAVKNSSLPQAQSVFSALQTSAGMEWDESIGKLSFVNTLFPEEIQAVWKDQNDVAVYAPMQGETRHAWTREEPYISIDGLTCDVRAAADGEVMSIAHGLNEERIIRIRHDDGNETLYGNLQSCYIDTGDRVYAGDVIGRVADEETLAFELRVDGRSINPENNWLIMDE